MTIETNSFVNGLIDNGYSHLCVVPCSFAKNLINAVINNNKIEYVPCASEAVVCSVAAGLKMSGKRPIVIAQSSGLTNMASCVTSLLKPYRITFPIIISWRTYKDGDSEIQHQHLATELPQLVAAYGYQHIIFNQNNLNTALAQIDECDQNQTICLLRKDTFSTVKLDQKHKLDLSAYIQRSNFLIQLNEQYKSSDTLFIGTTGNAAREMYSFMPDTNNFYMAGNMGGALSLGLGAAIAGKKVIVCGGDAEFVMHMGGLTTSGRFKDLDLTYILFDNESNKSTGGQKTYQTHVDYLGVAKSSNIQVFDKTIDNLDMFTEALASFEGKSGVKFLWVKCDVDAVTPRPPLNSVKVNEFA
ncbi:Phosphonopyruvate decarboxylase [hydrothermal vent metagenome]|uniref:Phosphonopyruvate decarboxylase n=1 Tax=hydrothermal vent metagenome TaxID=652676 RepID=A0A3B0VC75_9ZZZZ